MTLPKEYLKILKLQEPFKKIIHTVASDMLLSYQNFNKPFLIHNYSSDYQLEVDIRK